MSCWWSWRTIAAHGLPPVPLPGKDRPIVLSIIDKDKPLSCGALRLVLKEICARERKWESRAKVLTGASAHWLRHTTGSHMTDQRVDLRIVRDNFGHNSLSTTSGYLHSKEDARHEATQERHWLGWAAKGSTGNYRAPVGAL